MLIENMTARELENYAKENGYNSTQFICTGTTVAPFCGIFLDAYYGFVKIPLLGDGFTRLDDILNEYGERNLSFSIPESEEEMEVYNKMQYILRGKDIPN